MTTLPKPLRTRINRLAHDAAIRYEQQLRDQWTRQLSDAMEHKATFDELAAIVGRIEAAGE